jgi:hypothetical protein
MARCVLAFATLLMLLTALLRTWATSYLRSNVMQDHDLHAEKVVASGPYRHLRNPLYLGTILMAVGMGLLASRLGFVVIVVGNFIFCLRLIALEESNLQKEQGESYIEFCRRVPRFWPSLQPRLPDSGLKPHWKQAFVGELFMWGFFAAVAVFAITLNIKFLWIILAASMVAYIATSYLIAWRKKKRNAVVADGCDSVAAIPPLRDRRL